MVRRQPGLARHIRISRRRGLPQLEARFTNLAHERQRVVNVGRAQRLLRLAAALHRVEVERLQVRDAILCTPPPERGVKTLATPSEAAVERLLDDAWAAARQRPAATTPTTQRRQYRETSFAEQPPPASPSATTGSAGCPDAGESSPISVTCTRLDMSPVRGAFDSVDAAA